MIGLGTVANTAAIVVGGLVGLSCGGLFPERMRKTLVAGMSVATMFVGAGTTFAQMLKVGDGACLQMQGGLMLVVSLAIGGVLGEWMDLDDKFERFGIWLRRVTRNERDNSFIDAFVTASLTFCIGAMAIVGAIEDGLKGDASILYLKSVMDGIFTIILASSLGKGAVFSAIPILLYQGAITLGARLFAPVFIPAAMDSLSLVGGLLIFCVGWNLFHGRKQVKVANLLPALAVAIAWAFVVKAL